MGTYVIGDVHGCFDELMVLLKVIEKEDRWARFVFTGDLLDRGPKNVEMAAWAVKNIKLGSKYESVCGNHDDGLFEWAFDTSWHPYQYGTEHDFEKAKKIPLLKKYAQFVKTLPLYIEKEVNGRTFVITHGYIPANYKECDPFEENEYVRDQFYWDRSALYGAQSPVEGVTVVCGYNPVILSEWIECHPEHEICTVYVGETLVNVDTGCFHSGLLSAYRLEDGRVFYSGEPGVSGFEKRKM